MSDLKVTVHPTGRFEKCQGVDCRIWIGALSNGTPVEFYVPMVRAKADAPQEELERGLREVRAERNLVSFDTRML